MNPQTVCERSLSWHNCALATEFIISCFIIYRATMIKVSMLISPYYWIYFFVSVTIWFTSNHGVSRSLAFSYHIFKHVVFFTLIAGPGYFKHALNSLAEPMARMIPGLNEEAAIMDKVIRVVLQHIPCIQSCLFIFKSTPADLMSSGGLYYPGRTCHQQCMDWPHYIFDSSNIRPNGLIY